MSNSDRKIHPSTAVLTAGFDPALSVGSARPAVFRSSTYVFPSPEAAERAFAILGGRAKPEPGETADLIYSRFNHPNAEIVEAHLLPLENSAQSATVFNSGMAAIMTAIMAHTKPGDAIVYTVPIYGGTQSLIQNFLEPWGVHGIPVPGGDSAALDSAIQHTPHCRIVLIESPANPTLTMTDIARAVDSASRREPRPLVLVDNTFLGPAFQHPLDLGADLALYSATKYLGGFSDILAGVAVSKDPEIMRPIRARRSLFGNILAPDECWILDSRLPTVHLRMNRQSKNAQRIAEHLAAHPAVNKLYYPTLFTDPEQIRIREAQCDYPGAIFSVDLKGGKSAAFEFLRHLQVARNAVSLGGVETLVCHPRSTTHSAVSQQELQLSGVVDGLVRVSVGIEDWRDVLADFENALNRAAQLTSA
ncbi:MAG: aminotransferase class I/II-fold pyridoxal phosphate-dependent enzyme [Bryobacteraceae bacterium]